MQNSVICVLGLKQTDESNKPQKDSLQQVLDNTAKTGAQPIYI